MNSELINIINEIDTRINSINLKDEYKPQERKILKEILSGKGYFSIDANEIVDISKIILAGILINKQYKDIDEVIYLYNKYKEEIDSLSYDSLYNLCEIADKFKNKFSNIDELITLLDGDIEKIESKKNKGIMSIFGGKKNVETIEIFKLFVLADTELCNITIAVRDVLDKKELTEDIKESMKGSLLNNVIDMKKSSKVSIKNYIYETYDVIYINEQLSKVSKYNRDLNKENKKRTADKKLRLDNLSALKQILIRTQDNEEIKGIERICELTPIGLKQQVLRYIANKNQPYYTKLEQEYIDAKENSLANYIIQFNRLDIDFSRLSKNDQEEIKKIKVEKLKNVIDFLEDIQIDINGAIIQIIINANLEYIENLYKYIEKGILTKSFIKENIEVVYNENLYNKLIANITILLDNGINAIGLEQNGLFLGDSILIKENIDLIDKFQINIRTRHLKNYMFLLDINLEEKVLGLKSFNIDINNNLEVLNSDINIISRIKICQKLGIDIYDNRKIKQEILNKDQFFISDSKLNDYLPKELIKKM